MHLDERLRCGLFHSPLRPKVCGSLQPSRDMCHDHRDQALIYLARLEADTAP
ncbi:proteinase inhibitor [Escherichia coli]